MSRKVSIVVILSFALCLFIGAASAQANEAKILKDKVLKAAEYLSKKGPDGLAEFSDASSDWARRPTSSYTTSRALSSLTGPTPNWSEKT